MARVTPAILHFGVVPANAATSNGVIASEAKQSRKLSLHAVWIASAPRRLATTSLQRFNFQTTGEHAFAFPRHEMPESCVTCVPLKSKRAQGMPGEGLTHGPPAEKKQAAVTTGSAGSSGIPCAMVLRLIRDLPGEPGFLAPVARDHLASLTPASGCQDHTISPSAKPRSSASATRREPYVHRIPASRSVTIGQNALLIEGG